MDVVEDLFMPSAHRPDLRLTVLVAWGWLEHHLSLFSADGAAEVVAGCRKAGYLGLHFLLVTGIKGAVVKEEKVPENSLLHLRGSLQSPRVEQLPIRPERDVDARLALSKRRYSAKLRASG